MTLRTFLSPARSTLNPVLLDASVIDAQEGSRSLFYSPAAQRISRHMALITAVCAGLCLLTSFVLSHAGGPVPLANLFTFLAFVIAGLPALEAVWEKIAALRIDIDALMLLGAGLAAWVGNPFEGALLLFLFALSGGLETYALGKTRRAIVALQDLAPKEATLIRDNQTKRVPLRQVTVGAIILVKPGEKVPLDGTIISGGSSVDESAITGESIPRDCRVGDGVFAGTQNIDGRLEIRVTKLATDTTLARIVELVTEARKRPARAQRLIDRIGPVYSVAVVVSAVSVGLICAFLLGIDGNQAVLRAIAVLIVASPCALIIATPVAYLSAIAAAARHGVLIKGGIHLEVIAKTAVVAFDKTGTLTTGKVRLTDVWSDGSLTEDEVLRLAGAIEASSSHPLAAAVLQAMKDRSITAPAVTDYKSIPGQGESGQVDGQSVWIGRPALLAEQAGRVVDKIAEKIEALRREGKTASALVTEGGVALLGFADTLREGSQQCIESLRRQGVRHIEMLSGDHDTVARQFAAKLKLDGCMADLSPEGKVDALNTIRAKYGPVVLVGDGINDAPALAHADVGVAMGGLGADVALDAADVVLMKDRIERVPWLHQHALKTAGIVRQNLTMALGVIIVLGVFAAMGSVSLPIAVIGHEGSTVLVSLNALRLLRIRAAG